MDVTNTIQLIGHLGKAPEETKVKNGKSATYFPLATHDTYKNSSGRKTQDTQWHNCIAVGTIATRILTYVEKGDKVLITGKLTYDPIGDLNLHKRGQVFVKEILFIKKHKKTKTKASSGKEKQGPSLVRTAS